MQWMLRGLIRTDDPTRTITEEIEGIDDTPEIVKYKAYIDSLENIDGIHDERAEQLEKGIKGLK